MNTIKKSERDALLEQAKSIVRLDASGGIINMQAAVEILMASGVSKERARVAVAKAARWMRHPARWSK